VLGRDSRLVDPGLPGVFLAVSRLEHEVYCVVDLGPVQPVVARVKNRYREQILIKGGLVSADKDALLEAFKRVAEDEPGGRSIDMRWDVDPGVFT